MNLSLRLGKPEDADQCGKIYYEAFKAIAEHHNFLPDVPSSEVGAANFAKWLSHRDYYVVVAELDGEIVGSNVLDERSTIAGLGPILVAPAVQNRKIGRQLMQAVLARSAERGFPGVRLVQATYHSRSLCLYTALGFEVRELLVNVQGSPLALQVPGYAVRQALEEDLEKCNALCRNIHGHDRSGELKEAIQQGTATVVQQENDLTGYATVLGFWGHAVGKNNIDIQVLIGAAPEFVSPGFIIPARNGELFGWCLKHGFRVREPLTLMSMGLYNEPKGVFLPSIVY